MEIKDRAVCLVREDHRSISSVAKELGIPRTTLSTWINTSTKSKSCIRQDLEQRLRDAFGSSTMITEDNIRHKAEQIIGDLGHKHKLSKLWLRKFRKSLLVQTQTCVLCGTAGNMKVKGYSCGHYVCCDSCFVAYVKQVQNSQRKLFRCLVCNRKDVIILSC